MAFVVLEGIDGSGKETQARLLLDRLKRENADFRYIHYPEEDKPIGDLIYRFLRKEFALPPISVTLLYVADFLKDAEWIEQERKSCLVIANRFFTSTLAYEWALGVDIDTLIALGDVLPLPRPDAVVYIDVSPEEGVRRKSGDKQPDRFEERVEFQSRVRENYLYLAENGIFCNRWIVVNGERPPDEVFKDVWCAISALV